MFIINNVLTGLYFDGNADGWTPDRDKAMVFSYLYFAELAAAAFADQEGYSLRIERK